jgi:GNAT superfamily N-acetyltransferase
MPDMLVNLLKLPEKAEQLKSLEGLGVLIRRAQAFELTQVRRFIEDEFSVGWADEASIGFSRMPVTVFLATRDRRVIGFAAYECTRRAFFGPTGVAESERGKGAGQALLLECLYGLRELGYVYGIIGAAGPTEFYRRTVGATVIPDSEPGIYQDILRSEE